MNPYGIGGAVLIAFISVWSILSIFGVTPRRIRRMFLPRIARWAFKCDACGHDTTKAVTRNRIPTKLVCANCGKNAYRPKSKHYELICDVNMQTVTGRRKDFYE